MNAIYEKPKMKMVSLVNKNKVADANCWSRAANSGTTRWYYDYNDEKTGYITFCISTNCGGQLTEDFNIVPPSDADNAEASKQLAQLQELLAASGKDNLKQLFTDTGISDRPDDLSY